MNVCTFIGRLGRDVESRYTGSGKQVANFSIAVDKFGKDKDGEKKKPLWIRVNAWDKKAALAAKYLSKGKKVAVSGELDIREWTDREGAIRTSVELTAYNITLIDGGKREDAPPADDFEADNSGVGEENAAASTAISDEDIPF